MNCAYPSCMMGGQGCDKESECDTEPSRVKGKEIKVKVTVTPEMFGESVDVQELVRDALRWRALMSCERIRVLGSANLGERDGTPYQHIGLELWTEYPDNGVKSYKNEHKGSVEWFLTFIDTIVKRLNQ